MVRTVLTIFRGATRLVFVMTTGLRLTTFTTAGRAASAIWRAPPPMIALPQAHAVNFARAILTDMVSHSSNDDHGCNLDNR